MIKCCGAERSTPFCPSCGKRIMKPSPLVQVLEKYRKEYTKAKDILSRQIQLYEGHHSVKDKKQKVEELSKIVEALEESMSNLANPAKVMSDWLKDNGYEEAGKALLGAFTGVPS